MHPSKVSNLAALAVLAEKLSDTLSPDRILFANGAVDSKGVNLLLTYASVARVILAVLPEDDGYEKIRGPWNGVLELLNGFVEELVSGPRGSLNATSNIAGADDDPAAIMMNLIQEHLFQIIASITLFVSGKGVTVPEFQEAVKRVSASQ